jgi:hypothetical protein
MVRRSHAGRPRAFDSGRPRQHSTAEKVGQDDGHRKWHNFFHSEIHLRSSLVKLFNESRTGGSNERFEIVCFPNLEDPTLANVSYLLSLPFSMLNDQLSIIYLPLHPELLSRPSRRSRRKHTIKVIIQVVALEMRSEML